jgi:hypothetical protein
LKKTLTNLKKNFTKISIEKVEEDMEAMDEN